MFLLPESDVPVFPDPNLADASGLLALGGKLTPAWLLEAYTNGIFPWFSADDPILWHSPEERFVLYPDELRVSRSMRKVLEAGIFTITFDTAFDAVIGQCAATARKNQPGTWITPEMQEAYIRLNREGHAHSVEAWTEGTLAGGLYGVELNGIFCGESMFSTRSNASKAAFITLCRERDFRLIDCQVYTAHLERLGARHISREKYLELLRAAR